MLNETKLDGKSLNSEICNFADDNIMYSYGTSISEITTNLENDLKTLLNVVRIMPTFLVTLRFKFIIS